MNKVVVVVGLLCLLACANAVSVMDRLRRVGRRPIWSSDAHFGQHQRKLMSVTVPSTSPLTEPLTSAKTQEIKINQVTIQTKEIQLTGQAPFPCTPNTEDSCNYNGICIQDGSACSCDSGYVTHDSNDGTQCNYKQKSTLAAWLLQFFLGVESGAGYWYLGRTALAAGQLVLFWGGMIPVCFIACVTVRSGGRVLGGVGACYMCLWFLGMLAWWIYTLVVIGNGSISDGNGAPIQSL